ncbi:unnamed protein product, partial [marine sediment metagenome]
MPDFSYISVDQSGKISRGVITSSSCSEVRKNLEAKGLDLVSCQEQEEQTFGFNLDVVDLFKLIFYHQITPLDKISFSHHLGVMLKAGVPIIEAVESLGEEAASPKFKKVLKKLMSELEKGQTLSSFLEKEKVFSPAHLSILKSGEASGKVTESLFLINSDLKRDYQLKKKVKGAMAYPIIIILALIGVSGFIILFVLPKVAEVFKQMNLTTPLPTRILLALGSFMSQYFRELIAVSLVSLGAL